MGLVVLSDEQISLINSPAYSPGDILVFPDRLLKVTGLGGTATDGRTVYYVARAALGDAFDELSVSSVPATVVSSAIPQPHANAVTTIDNTSTVALDQWTVGFSSDSGFFVASNDCSVVTKLAQHIRAGITFNGGILDMTCQFSSPTGIGSVSIDGSVGIYGKFSDLNLHFNPLDLKAASARVTFEGISQRNGNLKIVKTGSFSIKNKEFLLGTIKVPFRIPSADPFAFTTNALLQSVNANWVIPLKIIFTANGDAAAQFDLNASRVDYFKVQYNQTAGTPAETSNTKQIDLEIVTVNFVGDASINVFSGLQMGLLLQEDVYGDKLDGLVGMQVTVGPKVVVKSNVVAAPLRGVSVLLCLRRGDRTYPRSCSLVGNPLALQGHERVVHISGQLGG